MFKVPEFARITTGRLASDKSNGNNGAFEIPCKHATVYCIASDGAGWEHVSVHVEERFKLRIPSWNEMCFVKNLFWSDQDLVVQYHPPKSEYVNNHPLCITPMEANRSRNSFTTFHPCWNKVINFSFSTSTRCSLHQWKKQGLFHKINQFQRVCFFHKY